MRESKLISTPILMKPLTFTLKGVKEKLDELRELKNNVVRANNQRRGKKTVWGGQCLRKEVKIPRDLTKSNAMGPAIGHFKDLRRPEKL